MLRSIILIVGLLSVFIFCSQRRAQPKIWVYDREYVLDPVQVKQLSDLYSNHEKKTTNEIVLITTPSFEPDTSILWYSLNKFRSLGIGKKEINNGVLIVYSGANRQVRIATGYGTEVVLTDKIAAKIIDSLMLPHFRRSEVFEGIWKGSKAIVDFLERPENKIK
jgi:uncharacterized protein